MMVMMSAADALAVASRFAAADTTAAVLHSARTPSIMPLNELACRPSHKRQQGEVRASHKVRLGAPC